VNLFKIIYSGITTEFKTFALDSYLPIVSQSSFSERSDDNSFKRGDSVDSNVESKQCEFTFSGDDFDVYTFKNLMQNTIRQNQFTIEIPRIEPFNDGDSSGSYNVRRLSIGNVKRKPYYYNISTILYKD
jgi:hypothetical protein